MNQRIKRTQRDYSLAFKVSLVEAVEKGELTYKQAQQRDGISMVTQVRSAGLGGSIRPYTIEASDDRSSPQGAHALRTIRKFTSAMACVAR